MEFDFTIEMYNFSTPLPKWKEDGLNDGAYASDED